MLEVEAELKKWGNSIGVLLPKKAAQKERLREGQKVRLLVLKKTNPIKETFGMLRFSRPTSKILKEVDQEAWDE